MSFRSDKRMKNEDFALNKILASKYWKQTIMPPL